MPTRDGPESIIDRLKATVGMVESGLETETVN